MDRADEHGLTASAAAASGKTPDLTDRQWYLSETSKPGKTVGTHLNLSRISNEYDGSGVTIGIFDDGIEYSHYDLVDAYDSSLHVTVNGQKHDPVARNENSFHGTSVAGIIAAADDDIGTKGIAPGARIAGVDILSENSDLLNQRLTFDALDRFDLTNHSWGYVLAYEFGGQVPVWENRISGDLARSTTTGRDGLGTVNIVAAGNDRWFGYNTNANGLTQSHHTVTVAAVDEQGKITDYSTPGPTILVSALGENIWTTDRTGAIGYNDARPRNDNPWADYTRFDGTSAATPQVTSIAALMLEANPGLGWRDVQTILAHSARHTGSALDAGNRRHESDDWDFNGADSWNGGGLHYSNDYGFGLIDAHAAVRLAETWTRISTTENLVAETGAAWRGSEWIRDGRDGGVEVTLDVETASLPELVSVDLEFRQGHLNTYRIVLVSPEGTKSILSKPQTGVGDLDAWTFSSREFLGEDPVGEWTLQIAERGFTSELSQLTSADLVIAGSPETKGRTLVFTNEYSDLAGGAFGHRDTISPRNDRFDTLNAAAVTSDTVFDFHDGTGTLDGIDVTLRGEFRRVFTGDGDDRLTAGDSGARFDAMHGHDRLRGGEGDDRLHGNTGHDTLSGDAGDDTLRGGTGRDDLRGGTGDDRLHGQNGADRISGNRGNDTLSGGKGHDLIRGGKGDDRMIDGTGADTLKGGDGEDRFILKTDGDTDRITDFEPGQDIIRLDVARFSGLDISRRDEDTWVVRHDGDRLLVTSQADILNGLSASDFQFL